MLVAAGGDPERDEAPALPLPPDRLGNTPPPSDFPARALLRLHPGLEARDAASREQGGFLSRVRLVELDDQGMLDTRALVVLRHALAVRREDWDGVDAERPLVPAGFDRAKALAPTLQAFGVDRIVSSPAARCSDSVAPFAAVAALKPRLKAGLSEEGHRAAP